METEELKESVSDLAGHLTDYAETYIRLSLVKVTERAASVASSVISAIVLCVLCLFVIFFFSMALGWWLGDLFESRALGFVATGGFYILLVVCMILMNKKVVLPGLRNLIVRKIYE
jgi:hypothetical protein